jgi:hypothetical protein
VEVAQSNVQVVKETLYLTRSAYASERGRQSRIGSITGIPGEDGTSPPALGSFEADSSSIQLHANKFHTTILRTTFLCGVRGDRVRLAIPF